MTPFKLIAVVSLVLGLSSPSAAQESPPPAVAPDVGCVPARCVFGAPEGVAHDGFRFQASSAPGTGSVFWDQHVSEQPTGTYFLAQLCNGTLPYDDSECGPASAVHQVPAAPAPRWSADWYAIGGCESGTGRRDPNWSINTGNGYYGGLQFSLRSWRGVGGVGYPHQASAEYQMQMAERLSDYGRNLGHWPHCGRHG